MNEHIINNSYAQNTFSPISRIVLTIGVVWFISILIASIFGVFAYSANQRPILILLAIILPISVFSLSYLNIPNFKNWILSLDMRRIILLHSWRMVGIGFIFLFFQDQLPALFALPTGLGDAMAAIGAVFLAIALYENSSSVSNKRIWQWNTFGLIDFIIAVSLGVMTRTGDILYIEGQVGSDIVSQFPQILVPGFFVPFYIITHLIIYAQLRHRN